MRYTLRYLRPLVAYRVLAVAIIASILILDAPAHAQSTYTPVPWELTTDSDEARSAFEAAFDGFVAFDNARALSHIERAVTADPNLGAARAFRAFLRQEFSGGPEFGRAVADAAQATAPEAMLALTFREWRAGRTARARALVGALNELRADDRRMAVIHATSLLGDAEPDALRRLAQEHPDYGPAYLWLANWITPPSYVPLPPELEREGLEAARAAVRLSPESPAAHTVLARLLERVGNNEEALQHIGHAIELDDTPALTHEIAAEIHLQDGRIAESRRALETALAAARGDPERLTYRRGLALLHLHEGNLEASTAGLRALSEEAEREGRNGNARTSHQFLAIIYAAAGDAENALHHLSEAWRVAPAAQTQAIYATTVHAWLGNIEEARAALENYIEMAGPEPTESEQDYIHLMTGQVLLAEEKPEEALESLARAGDNPYVQLARWEAYLALGRAVEAAAERQGLLERKTFTVYSTAIPIARYRARRVS